MTTPAAPPTDPSALDIRAKVYLGLTAIFVTCLLLANIVAASGAEVTLLDNIEILFDVNLKQDPLRLLQGISRNRTVVAAWNGTIEGNHLVYAIPGHTEYRRYPLQDYLIVAPEAASL